MDSNLSDLVGGRSEDPRVEYKSWMDTSSNEVRAKIARHIAALANHGGGYLVFGVDDASRAPTGATALDPANFDQRRLSEIAQRYLDPAPHVDVDQVVHEGVAYPVASIRSHGDRSVVASRDGPQDGKGAPQGIRQGDVYVREAGPRSVRATTADHWTPLIERCLTHRSDLLAKVMRQAIARPGKPSREAFARLVAIADETDSDFADQTRELSAGDVYSTDRERVSLAATAHCVLAYALLDGNGEPIELSGLRGLVERAAVNMRQVALAHDDWHAFLPLTYPTRAPQVRTATTPTGDVSYLEGMRLPKAAVVGDVLDYWRIYEAGFAAITQSYREDYIAAVNGFSPPYLTVAMSLRRIHSLLAHARFIGEETPRRRTGGDPHDMARPSWPSLAGDADGWLRGATYGE